MIVSTILVYLQLFETTHAFRNSKTNCNSDFKIRQMGAILLFHLWLTVFKLIYFKKLVNFLAPLLSKILKIKHWFSLESKRKRKSENKKLPIYCHI